MKALILICASVACLCLALGVYANNSAAGGSFTDPRDNQTYRTVRIGNRTLMAENLNYRTDSSWCYDDDPSNCDKYGRLYTWSVAMGGSSSSEANPSGVRGVCPVGWHLPSDAEWTELVNALGGDGVAGAKLKSMSGWYNNGDGTDVFGFSALPGGFRDADGGFEEAAYEGSWWSATEHGAMFAWFRYMNYRNANVDRDSWFKANASSVRCVRE